MTRVKTAKGFYNTMIFYRNNGVDTTGLLASKNQQTVAAHEQDLVALVKSTTITSSTATPQYSKTPSGSSEASGFGGGLVLVGIGAAAILFVRRYA